jgi:hypothetical protein
VDRELVKDWITALRSGEYEQGKDRLRPTPDTYCCLGVAADVAIKTGKLPFAWNGAALHVNNEEWGVELSLPTEYDDVFGFGLHSQGTLSSMNDDEEKTFPEIADYIERFYLKEGE